MPQFDGKVAFVTGAGSGIGRDTALMFAHSGAAVMAVDIVEKAAQETVQVIRDKGGKADCAIGDVANPADVERFVRETIEKFGRLDYACNNAGIGGDQVPVTDMSIENWNRVIGINLTGVFLGMKYQIPAMLKNGGGAIVNIASILGTVGFAAAAAYVAAKHGVVGLTKVAAIEYATAGVRVNAIGPGFIYTPLLTRHGFEEGSDAYNFIAGLHPVKRLGKSSEVAEAVVWLCSDSASFVTGTTLLVDGGYTAQ